MAKSTSQVRDNRLRLEQGGKHPKVRYCWRGVEQFYVVPGTPGDTVRGIQNAISDLRRILGLQAHEKKVGARRVSKRRVAASGTALPDHITALPDWRGGIYASLSPRKLRECLDAAWLAYWRQCMRNVGGESIL